MVLGRRQTGERMEDRGWRMAGTAIRFGEGIQLHNDPNGGALGVGGVFPFLIMRLIETGFGVYE